ncbi:HAMP domain-containing histidine kinase [Gracilibacillus oryzae]|uniref:histidine kinase n=1 Tax=Gracilibacillus oryzae TaxID=1672701 RepID=A0A7C8GQA2_9BACI|nr:HAMP domain-containing sensor histidine kinase [Gracilibacillus oryzae]KAB8126083.1 HAMP domain-containing histidine kinase [Gracilibacillus oryzae]
MSRRLKTFRTRMLFLFGQSMLFAGITTYVIFKMLQWYYYTFADYGDSLAQLRSQIRNIGDIYFFLVFFIPISILFFYQLTRRYSAYFEEISTGIHYLARGDFSYRVEIESNDEFRKIAQDINLASEKLQEATERGDFSENSKDQLVVNLAHDLRTPLTSVIGYIDIILKEEELTEEQVKHFLMIASTKSHRLERLIDELFEITRMNYGMLPIHHQPIDLADLLHQLKEELYPLFEKNELEVRMNLPDSLPIMADGELLARVFENLLTNANRYGYDGKYIDINGFTDDGEVIVQLTNYGDPIPEDELPYLFDMFYTGDKSRTQQIGSTGLGLFIAKNILERHSGTITAESNIVRTVFEVRLPQENENDREI